MCFQLSQIAIKICYRRNVKAPLGFKGVTNMQDSSIVFESYVHLCDSSKAKWKHCAAKETIKTCFKKLLKQSGVFNVHEILVLLL